MTSEASEIIPLSSTTIQSSTASVMDTHESSSIPASHSSNQQTPSKSSKHHQANLIQAPTASSQEFCLRWNNYQTNLTIVFDQLLQNESFVDCTLACDGHSIKAHKMVLSACSPYFQTLFVENPCQHPIIIMRDVKWSELKAIVEFMYKGEINVNQDQIGPLLHVAEMLKIRGLADVTPDQELNTSSAHPYPILGDVTAIPTNSNSKNNNSNSKSSGNSSSNSKTSYNNNVNNNNNNNVIEKSTGHHSHGHHSKKSMISARDWADVEAMEAIVAGHNTSQQSSTTGRQRKRKWHSAENNSIESPLGGHETPDRHLDTDSPNRALGSPSIIPTPNSMIHSSSTPIPMANFSIPPPNLESLGLTSLTHPDEMEIKPGIAEMIREEERAKLMENSHPWLGASTSSLADQSIASHSYASSSPSHSYQYQLQSMWQKCWNTNQNLIHHLRFRERGPLKSWRPETMAEAIFSVLKEGLSLSQAARKYDIPYPTFVLYANRVHNMLGPSIDGGTDLRPKGRGRPQRILLGIWPEEHIKNVIKSVVFRDAKDFKDDPAMQLAYGRHSPVFPFQDGVMNYSVPSAQSPMGNSDSLSPDAATAAAISAMAHGLRQQMQMAGVHPDMANFSLSPHCAGLSVQASDELGLSAKLLDPKLNSPGEILSNGSISLTRVESPLRHDTKSLSPEHSPNHHKNRHGSPSNEISISITTSGIGTPKSSRLKAYPPNQKPSQHNQPIDEDNSIDSELEMTVEPAVNIAVGVSGMAYKASRNFSSPRSAENLLFVDECNDGVLSSSNNNNSNNSSCGKLNDGKTSRSSSRLSSNFKESPSAIKVEPIISECRGD